MRYIENHVAKLGEGCTVRLRKHDYVLWRCALHPFLLTHKTFCMHSSAPLPQHECLHRPQMPLALHKQRPQIPRTA